MDPVKDAMDKWFDVNSYDYDRRQKKYESLPPSALERKHRKNLAAEKRHQVAENTALLPSVGSPTHWPALHYHETMKERYMLKSDRSEKALRSKNIEPPKISSQEYTKAVSGGLTSGFSATEPLWAGVKQGFKKLKKSLE